MYHLSWQGEGDGRLHLVRLKTLRKCLSSANVCGDTCAAYFLKQLLNEWVKTTPYPISLLKPSSTPVFHLDYDRVPCSNLQSLQKSPRFHLRRDFLIGRRKCSMIEIRFSNSHFARVSVQSTPFWGTVKVAITTLSKQPYCNPNLWRSCMPFILTQASPVCRVTPGLRPLRVLDTIPVQSLQRLRGLPTEVRPPSKLLLLFFRRIV